MKPYAESRRPLALFAPALAALVALACASHAPAAARRSHTGMVMALAFSPDDRSLFVTRDHDVILRSVADGRTLRTFRGHLAVVNSLAVSGDGKTLITGGEDGSVKLWSVETGRVTAEPAKGTPGDDSDFKAQVNTVALSPDGRLAAWGNNAGDLTLWAVPAGKRLRTLREEPRASVRRVAFSASGGTLFSAGGSGNVVQWDVATGRKLTAFEDDRYAGVRSMSVSADGRRVLTVGGMKIRLWDSATGKELLAFSKLGEGYYTPRCAAFTPDGTRAISGDDSRVYVWDLKTGAKLKTLKDPPFSHVESVAVSHGGEFVTAGDIFGSVRLWRYATGEHLWPRERRGADPEAE